MPKNFFNHRLMGIISFLGCLSIILIQFAGCATPVGVSHVAESQVYKQIDQSALTSMQYSSYTSVTLHRHGIENDQFTDNPEQVISDMHHVAEEDERRDLLLALSELCYLTAKKSVSLANKQEIDEQEFFYRPGPKQSAFDEQPLPDPQRYFLGSAVYAYLFLLGPSSESMPDAFDRRFRMACDLYNRSLSQLLKQKQSNKNLESVLKSLPVSEIRVFFEKTGNTWDSFDLEELVPADELMVKGLSIRNRIPGLGSAMVAVRKKSPTQPIAQAIPATVFFKIEGTLKDISEGKAKGIFSIHSAYTDSKVMINNHPVPLEMDLTAPVAYVLNDPFILKASRSMFRLGRSPFKSGIYPAQPYAPGLIPIVFVHGTMSSPVYWAEMMNMLRSDPVIRQRFQVWLYMYDSAKPVNFSAVHLRDSITGYIEKFDPERKDPALKDIVVVGHSQGGLLTRLTAVETGDVLIQSFTGKSIEEMDLTPEDRKLLNRYAVFHPMPEVKRIVFLSTPHRGSFLADSFVRKIARKLLSLPKDILSTGKRLVSITSQYALRQDGPSDGIRTSLDSMSPENPAVLAMAELPMPPGVKSHSIVAIDGDEQPPEGDDGVVKYTSAHLDQVDSEFIIRSGHSCQENPLVIEEVRRILMEHINAYDR